MLSDPDTARPLPAAAHRLDIAFVSFTPDSAAAAAYSAARERDVTLLGRRDGESPAILIPELIASAFSPYFTLLWQFWDMISTPVLVTFVNFLHLGFILTNICPYIRVTGAPVGEGRGEV